MRSLGGRLRPGPNKKRWLILRVAVTMALLAILLARARVSSFVSVLAHADPVLATLGLAVGIMTTFLSAMQWQILLRQEEIHMDLPLVTSLYYLGVAFSQVLPTAIGGDVAKAAYAARLSGRTMGAVGATLMARLIGFLALLLTALPVAVAASLMVPGLGWKLTLILLAVALAFASGVGVVLAGVPLLGQMWGEAIGRYRLGQVLLELAENLAQYRRHRRTFLAAALLGIAFYVALYTNFYCYGLAFHLHVPFWFYWIAIPLMSIATMLPISLNGYGVRGASLVILFALMGEPAAASLSLSLAMEVQLLLFAVVGAAVIAMLSRRARIFLNPSESLVHARV